MPNFIDDGTPAVVRFGRRQPVVAPRAAALTGTLIWGDARVTRDEDAWGPDVGGWFERLTTNGFRLTRMEEDRAMESYYIEPVQPVLRRFVEDFRNIVAREAAGSARLGALRAPVEALLGDASWITEEFLVPVPATTATWAVYRSQEPDLCIFTMVVPPLNSTKVHNHLTDGWVGLVQGAQVERHFQRFDDGSRPG